ncbi:MAG: hypothetical protein K9I85_07755 [Saprospiraceae bacterium]|nr:hypothetical protein [Saprospiraceae bacterium]
MAVPLLKKLEYKEGMAVGHWPSSIVYEDQLRSNWQPMTEPPSSPELDLIHIFCPDQDTLEKQFFPWKAALKKDGRFWISWPKKSSKVPSDLDENILRDFGLENGLVDVKVASVDDVWSALKFVYRLKDR